jgi:hypothetical protein
MPTLAQIQELYSATRTAASRFSSYNFQQYFLRRTDALFAAPLASMGDTTTVKSSGTEKLDEAALSAFVEAATAELAAAQRAATLNAIYAHNKLVVENESSRHGD